MWVKIAAREMRPNLGGLGGVWAAKWGAADVLPSRCRPQLDALASAPPDGASPAAGSSSPAVRGLNSERRAAASSPAVTLRGWWQAARWPFAYSVSGGSTGRHISVACGQRGWKRQAGGGHIGLGGPALTAGRGRARFSPRAGS